MQARNILGGLLLAVVLAVALMAGASYSPEQSEAGEPARFASYEELVRYIDENTGMARQFSSLYGRGMIPFTGAEAGANEAEVRISMPAGPAGTADRNAARQAEKVSPGFSGTNNQVRGVDEADLVKTDGNYLYIISGDKLFILRAHTAGEPRKLSEIKFDGHPAEAFINGDTLVVFGSGPEPETMFSHNYNVTDRSKPELVQENKCDGYYVNSRMIGDYIYAVNSAPVNRPAAKGGGADVTLPKIITDGQVHTISPTEIHFFPYPDYSYRYTTVLTLNTRDASAPVRSKTFLTGTSQNLYVSQDNIYLTGNKAPDFNLYTEKLLDGLAASVSPEIAEKIKAVRNSGQDYGTQLQRAEEIIDDYLNRVDYEKALALEEKIAAYRDKWHRDMARDQNKTVIYKLAIMDGRVEYRARGEVDGQALNQFSMDEHNDYFRIATTSEGFWFTGTPNPKNNLYVLDENLKVTGKLLGLAPTERIYSARFLGDRAYLVTFRQMDPLFVIDLKNPAAPKVLGELKIPGFSNYLHPYDENHLIGIGKEVGVASITIKSIEVIDVRPIDKGDAAPVPVPDQPVVIQPPTRQQGVKIALFDVSNPALPKEVANYVLDRDDADSLALHDHRAVLFSRERNLLVLPISYMPQHRTMIDTPDREIASIEQGWRGAFVFDISPQKGIKLRGKVEHPAAGDTGKGYYNYNTVKRSLYIDDVLYTVSDRAVMLNNLENLRRLKEINLR